MASSDQEDQKLAIRQHLQDAYAALEADKRTRSFSAITFEELLAEQAERIERTTQRAIDRVEANVQAAARAVQALPPGTEDTSHGVNTKV